MLEAVQELIEQVLGPVLEKDASGIELLELSEEELVVSVKGRAAFGAGAEYVCEGVIEPALRKVLGPGRAIRIEKTVAAGKKKAHE
jgi:hypothetical protein